MSKTFSTKQIQEAIAHWTKILESKTKEAEEKKEVSEAAEETKKDDKEVVKEAEAEEKPVKKSLKEMLKEGFDGLSNTASIAKSAAIIATQVDPAIKAIERLAAALEKAADAANALAATRK